MCYFESVTIMATKVQEKTREKVPSVRIQIADVGVNFCSKQFQGKTRAQTLQKAAQLVENAKAKGVVKLIGITNHFKELPLNLEICRQHANDVFCTAGVHPHSVKDLNEWEFAKLKARIEQNLVSKHRSIVAIGECGLDYDRMFSSKAQHQKWFRRQLDLAVELKLPVYLHSRKAHADFIRIMREKNAEHDGYFKGRALVHCFTEGWTELKDYLDSGFLISVSGWVTDDRRNSRLVVALQEAKKNSQHSLAKSIMVETDAPWLKPKNIRDGNRKKRTGSTNYPEFVMYVLKGLCEVLALDEAAVSRACNRNCRTFFKI